MNKKGSLADVITIGVVLFVIAVVTLLVFKVNDEINTVFQTSDAVGKLSGASDARQAMNTVNSHFSGVIDNTFLFLAVGLAVVAITLSFLVAVHPIFLFFYFVMLTFMIFLCGIFSNVYQEMASNVALAAQADKLIFISHILTYLPFIVGVFGFVIAIVMYKTWQNSQ